MGLLSPCDPAVLKQHLSTITKKVTCLLFTQTIGGPKAAPSPGSIKSGTLNDKIETSKELRPRHRDKTSTASTRSRHCAAQRRPDTHEDGGAPTGYEFVPLVEAIIGGHRQHRPRGADPGVAPRRDAHPVFSTPT
jgi:hypothetical protein